MPVGASHKGYPPRRPPTQNNKGSKIINHQALSGAFVSLFYLSSFGKKIPNPKPSKSAISCTTTLTKSACWTLSQRVPPLRPPTQNNKGSRIINLQALSGALSLCSVCLLLVRKIPNPKPSKSAIFCTTILTKSYCWTLSQRLPPWRPPTQNNKGSRIINLQALSGALCLCSVSCLLLTGKISNPKPSKRAIFCTTTPARNACRTLSQRVPPLKASNPE